MAGTSADKLNYLQATKEAIRQAIAAKGVDVPESTTFRQYAGRIGEIQSGGNRITSINVITGGAPNQMFQVRFPVTVHSGQTIYTPNYSILIPSATTGTFTCDCAVSDLFASPGIVYMFFKNSGSNPEPGVNMNMSMYGETLTIDGSGS